MKLCSYEEIKTKDKWLKHLTNINIPQDIKHFLALGYIFSLSPTTKDISISKLLYDIECLITGFNHEKKMSSEQKSLT